MQQLSWPFAVLFVEMTAKSHPFFARSFADDVFETNECTAANKQNIRGIYLQKLLLRVFSTTFRWHTRHRSFDDFQKSLLNALTGDVARDRWIVRFPGNLVYLIDVNDSP